MRVLAFVRRYRWSVLLVLVAGLGWWLAFDYLVDFRKPDVPFVTTPHDVVAAMLDLAEVSEGDTLYDLGSGDGRVLLAAARRGARAVGIEIDPELARQSREAARADDVPAAGRQRAAAAAAGGAGAGDPGGDALSRNPLDLPDRERCPGHRAHLERAMAHGCDNGRLHDEEPRPLQAET
jgi:SAM-dependent methyltransferase